LATPQHGRAGFYSEAHAQGQRRTAQAEKSRNRRG